MALPWATHVQEILKAEPGLSTAEVLRRVRIEGYPGGKTALYQLAGTLRWREVPPPDPFRRGFELY